MDDNHKKRKIAELSSSSVAAAKCNDVHATTSGLRLTDTEACARDDDCESPSVRDATPPFLFGGKQRQVDLLPALILEILSFLTHAELTHSLGLVNKAWRDVTRLPQLWKKLDCTNYKVLSLPMRDRVNYFFRDVLQRPQFETLTSLALPQATDFSNSILELLANCKCGPLLEAIDLGQDNFFESRNSIVFFRRLPSLFPRLSRLGVQLSGTMADYSIPRFCTIMGPRLLELNIRTQWISSFAHWTIVHNQVYLSDDALATMAKSCPNLARFGYFIRHGNRYDRAQDRLTAVGVQALLARCQKLQALVLIGADRVSFVDAFESVATQQDMCPNLSHLVVHGVGSTAEGNSLLEEASPEANRIRQYLQSKVKYCRWKMLEGVIYRWSYRRPRYSLNFDK